MNSNLSAFDYIKEGSEATPGLFNRFLSALSANIAAVDSNVTLNFSGATVSIGSSVSIGQDLWVKGAATIGAQPSTITRAELNLVASSAVSDYILFEDSSAAKSSYMIGSRVGGIADGLNLWDVSGDTMIVSFSKQSVRFFQNVVGPVFDIGGALASTYNAETFGPGSKETKIQAAINQASIDGIARVYVPASLLSYSASSISFVYPVQMVREGGNWREYDVAAYGAWGGMGTHDDTTAIQSAISAAVVNGGGTVSLSNGTFLVSGLTISGLGITLRGTNRRRSTIYSTMTGDIITIGYNDGLHSGSANAYSGLVSFCVFEDFGITGPGSTTSARGFVDWKCGSNTYRRLQFNQLGTGFFGIGSDVNEWDDIYAVNCGTGLDFASRCDQQRIVNPYIASCGTGIRVEYAYHGVIFGGQFVGNTDADIVFDAPATGTNGGDVRTDVSWVLEGVWFESLTTPVTKQHVWFGRQGTSANVLQGLMVRDAFVFNSGTSAFLVNDAGNAIRIKNLLWTGSLNTIAHFNTVGGVSPYADVEVGRSLTTLPTGNITFVTASDYNLGGVVNPWVWANGPAMSFVEQSNRRSNQLTGDGFSTWAFNRNIGTFTAPNHQERVLMDTGSNASTWMLRVGGVSAGTFDLANYKALLSAWTIRVPDGTALSPTYGWTSDKSLGFYHSGVSTMALSYGGLALKTQGAAGANASCGTAVLVSGTPSQSSVLVSTTYVKTGDIIMLTDQSVGGTLGSLYIAGIANSSSFTIASTSITDTSTVAWMILRPLGA